MPCDAWSSATFSNARDPLRGSKRPKSQFYGHYGPHISIFGTLFSANLFSLQNMGMLGVQSNAMWCLVLMQPFQTQGSHSAARNGQKMGFGVQNCQKIDFLAILSHWHSPLGLKRLRKAHASHGKTRGPTQQLKTAKNWDFGSKMAIKLNFWPFWASEWVPLRLKRL